MRNANRTLANANPITVGAGVGDAADSRPVTKILDADISTASMGILNNFTIDPYVNFFDGGNQVNLSAANTTSIFTMNKFSILHIGTTVGTTTYPTNYNNRTDRRIHHVTSTIAYDANGNQTVTAGSAANNARPQAVNNTNFIYGSLLLASPSSATMRTKTTGSGTLYVANQIRIRNNANLIDNERQIIGNYNATGATDFTRTGAVANSMNAAIDSTQNVTIATSNPTFTMEAGSQLTLGGATRNTTFPLLYAAGDISLAPTSTVVYQARTAANSIQYLAGGITYGI